MCHLVVVVEVFRFIGGGLTMIVRGQTHGGGRELGDCGGRGWLACGGSRTLGGCGGGGARWLWDWVAVGLGDYGDGSGTRWQWWWDQVAVGV